MEYLYTQSDEVMPQFISAGTFIGSSGWRHSRRVIDSFELIFPIEGVLPIQIGDTKYLAGEGSLVVVPPFIAHQGYQETSGKIKFDWFHFNLPGLAETSQNTISSTNLNQYSLLLPQFSVDLMIERIYVMTNQLLDINELHCDFRYRNSILTSLLFEITYQMKQIIQTQTFDNHELQPIRDWIRVHALEHLDLEQIANYFNYNKSYLSRLYKNHFHVNITQEVTRFRIEAAKPLLVETNKTIEEIADLIGYNDAKYFMKIFKKSTGMTPSRYRMTFHQRHFNNH